MVVVEIPTKTFKKALGVEKQNNETFKKEIDETLFKIGMELENINDETTSIEISGAGNRIDLLSLEGISRMLNAYNGKKVDAPTIKKSNNVLNVDKSVAGIRDYIAVFIARGVTIDEDNLKRLINYQEKAAKTFGRDRKVLGMGLFNLGQLKFPLTYSAKKPEEIKFAPLGFETVMNGKEILQNHPKGKDYAWLFNGKDKLPVLCDASGKILTMPGITNSNDLGKVQSGKNQDLLIEVTGTNALMVQKLATSNALDFANMGAQIELVTIKYPSEEWQCPNLTNKEMKLTVKYVNDTLGLQLNAKQITDNLQKMQLQSKTNADAITVQVPFYRSDILHEIDLVEDIARVVGYDNFEPQAPDLATTGQKHAKTRTFQAAIETFESLQFQQVYGMVLSNTEEQITKMSRNKDDEKKLVKLFGSRALGLNCARDKLLPGLLGILSTNKQYEYPHKIFEVGETLQIDEKEETNARTDWKTACIIASATASYSEVKAIAENLARNFDCKRVKFTPVEDPAYIKGRCAKISTEYFEGILGEVSIAALRKYGLEMPCAALEVTLKKEVN